MVDDPLRTLVEQRRARMNEYLLVVADSFEALGRVLTTGVVEETCTNRLANLGVVLHLLRSAGDHRQVEPLHDLHQLLAHILASLHSSGLNKILVAPLILEAMHFPCLIDCQHGQVISVFVVELRSLLIGKLLLLTGTVENVLD